MMLNKKYFMAISVALGIQSVFGVNLVNAMQCESEMKQTWEEMIKKSNSDGKWPTHFNAYLDGKYSNDFYETMSGSFDESKAHQLEHIRDFATKSGGRCAELAKQSIERNDGYYNATVGDNRYIWSLKELTKDNCILKTLIQNNCSLSVFERGGSGQQSNSSSSSGSSSNQPSSVAASNSPESYNLQVSQNNKQNYQTLQRAYEQANSGKGKKHNKEANATECMKNNPAQKSFTNKCNQPINFAYCFSGVPTGAKNENPQTLADLSCQNGQFGTLTIGAGESIPGTYNGLLIGGLPCKSPSQPVDMAFDRATNTTTGRCSF